MKPVISARLERVEYVLESLTDPKDTKTFTELDKYSLQDELIKAYHALKLAKVVIHELNEYAISVTPPKE